MASGDSGDSGDKIYNKKFTSVLDLLTKDLNDIFSIKDKKIVKLCPLPTFEININILGAILNLRFNRKEITNDELRKQIYYNLNTKPETTRTVIILPIILLDKHYIIIEDNLRDTSHHYIYDPSVFYIYDVNPEKLVDDTYEIFKSLNFEFVDFKISDLSF
jgi:hypothetical protein